MGTEDKIVILIEAVDKTNQTLSDLQKKFNSIKTSTKEASTEALGFGKLLGGITIGNQLSQAISTIKDRILSAAKATLKWSGDMETFGLSITSSLVTGGKYIDQMTGKALSTAESFSIARKAAGGILQELQAANLQTIATLDQLTRVYVETLPIALQKGFNVNQVKDFTLAVVQAAGAIGLEMDMIAEETRAMLTPSINPRFSRVAVALGLTNEDIRQNSQNADTLFNFLMKKLEGFRLAGELTQRTWKGLWSNLKDIGLQAGSVVLEPLFVGIKNYIEITLAGIIKVNEETKKIEWNPDFLKTMESAKTILNDLITLANGLAMALKGVIFPGTAAELIFGKNEQKPEDALKTDEKNAKGNLEASQKGGWAWKFLKATRMVTNPDEPGNYLYDYKNNLTDADAEKYFKKQLEDAGVKRGFAEIVAGTKAKQDYEKRKEPNMSDQYGAMLDIVGKIFSIDPNFLRSVLVAESGGDPLALSKKGAIGLMQIMPSNVQEFMEKLSKNKEIGPMVKERLKGFGSLQEAAFDPMLNMLMGGQYLRENFNREGADNIPATLGAYNAGPWSSSMDMFRKTGRGLKPETEKYITDIEKNYAKFKGTDILASPDIRYQGNEQMSKSDIEMSKSTYDTKMKLLDKFTKDETLKLESGADLKLAVLKKGQAEGVVSQEQFDMDSLAITKEKNDKEIALIDNQIAEINQAWIDAMSQAPAPPDEEGNVFFRGIFGDAEKTQEEATKAIVMLENLEAKKQVLIDKTGIAEVEEGTKKAALNAKILQINDQQATSYENMSNTIATEIDKIKVKNNEMLPGDAMVAEHDRQVEALENHLIRLAGIMAVTSQGSDDWAKLVEQIKGVNQELDLLFVKRPEVVKKGTIANVTDETEKAKAINQQRMTYLELTGQMDAYNQAIIQTTISELQLKLAKAETGDERAWIRAQLEFHKENLAFYEQYGPAIGGFRDGLRELGKEAGNTGQNFKDMAKGMVTAFSSSIGTMLEDWMKFDGNFMKDLDALKNYWKDFWGKLVTIFVDMIEKMIIKWIAFKALTALGINIDIGGGGGGGGFSWTSAAGLVYDYFTGGSGVGGTVGKWFGGGAGGANATGGVGAANVTGGAGMAAGSGAAAAGMGGADVAGLAGYGTGGAALGGTGGTGLAPYAAAAFPAMMVAGMAFVTYKLVSEMAKAAVDDEEVAKRNIASAYLQLGALAGKGEGATLYKEQGLVYAGTGGGMVDDRGVEQNPAKRLYTDSSDTEKIAFITSYRKEMRMLADDAKFTDEQIENLVKEALGPQNEELLKASKLSEDLNAINTDLNKTYEDGFLIIGKSTEQLNDENKASKRAAESLAGMSQKMLESLPDLMTLGSALQQIGVNYDTYNSKSIDAALLTNDLSIALSLFKDGVSGEEVGQFNSLLEKMKGAINSNGQSILSLVPGLEKFLQILELMGIAIDKLPESKTIKITTTTTTTPTVVYPGGSMGRFHNGGLLKYHPWGGSIGGDEVPIIAQKGEYVLSRKDVEFIDKVKGMGYAQVNNIPAIMPKVNVIVNNQSSSKVKSAGAVRMSDDSYIIDVLLKDIHANGRFSQALNFR